MVGTGYGLRVAAPAYIRHGSFQLGAIVGRDVERTRHLLRACSMSPGLAMSFEELADRRDFDLIHVASPNVEHEPQVRRLAANPASLLLEKPLSLIDEGQQDMAELLLSRAATTYVNFPLRASRMVPTATFSGGNRSRATVHFASSFRTRYQDTVTWKTEPASGGGIYHMLLPHVCDYVLQLLRAAEGRLTTIQLLLSTDTPVVGECLDIRIDDPSGALIAFSSAEHVPSSEDTFAWLFRDVVERLFATLPSSRINGVEPAGIGSNQGQLAGVRDLLLAYRLCRFLVQQSPDGASAMSWRLDGDAIGRIESWLRPVNRLARLGGSHE